MKNKSSIFSVDRFIDIHDDGFSPTKHKVAGSSSDDDGEGQPKVKGHNN